MVIVPHSYEGFSNLIHDPLQSDHWFVLQLKNFISNLAIGVDVFFVISGFLITYLLLLEKNKQGNINVFKFIMRRSLRIWPLYFWAILLGFIMVHFFSQKAEPNYIANIFFLNNFNAIHTNQWQFPFAHFWSICVEEHFYLVWPFIIFLTPLKNVPFVTILLIAGSIASRLVFTLLQVQPYQMYLHVHTLSRMDEILIGALVACVHFKNPIQLSIDRKTRLLVYVLFICLLFMEQYNSWDGGFFVVMFKKYIYLGFIVFWLLNYLFNESAFFNFRSKNMLHYFGKISFGIYIYHNMIIEPLLTKVALPLGMRNIAYFELLYLIILIGISILSFECYEKYFLKIKNNFAIIKTSR